MIFAPPTRGWLSNETHGQAIAERGQGVSPAPRVPETIRSEIATWPPPRGRAPGSTEKGCPKARQRAPASRSLTRVDQGCRELRPRARRRLSAAAVLPRTGRASLASRCSLVGFWQLSWLQLLAFWPSVVSSRSLDGGPSGIRGPVGQECAGSWLTTQKVMPNSIFINFSQKRRKYWACKRLR